MKISNLLARARVEPGSYARLRVSGFDAANSTGGDSLWYHDGMVFTTKDRDRDQGYGKTATRATVRPRPRPGLR